MNKGIFKLIFSRRWGMRVPVSEALPTPHSSSGQGACLQSGAGSARYASLKPLAWAVALALAPPSWANPTGAQVVHGSASFAVQGNTLTVTNSPNAIINWQSFSIPGGSTTHFAQQSASSAVLNRVVGADPSHILGTLSSNGRVFLINPAGILVGAGARIDVNGLVASTLNLSNADFLAGRLNFSNGLLGGEVKNQGSITTPQGGQVYLVGKNVTNEGNITSPNGEVILAAGETVDILDSATPDVKVEITGTGTTTTNLGQVVADSGRIGVLAATVRNQGTLNASSAVAEGGKIFLRASQRNELTETSNIQADGTKGGEITVITNEHGQIVGELVARGTISAQGTDTLADGRQAGGFVDTSASNVDFAGVSVKASGGSWLIDPVNITIGSTEAATIVTSLNAGTSVTLDTNQTGSDAGDITLNSAIAKTAGVESTLTLKANNNIRINSGISSTSGKLNVSLNPDSDANGYGGTFIGSGIDSTITLNLNGGILSTPVRTQISDDKLVLHNAIWNNTSTLTLTGTGSYGGGAIELQNGASFNNAKNSDIYIYDNAAIQTVYGGTGTSIVNRGNIYASWSDQISGNDELSIQSGNIENYGLISTSVGSALLAKKLTVSGLTTNRGSLSAGQNSTISATQLSSNLGVIELYSQSSNIGTIETSHETLTNTGLIRGEGTVKIGAGNGTLINQGRIHAKDSESFTTDPTGNIRVEGNFEQSAGGSTRLELLSTTTNGNATLQSSQLNLTGNAILDGTLETDWWGDYNTSVLTSKVFPQSMVVGGTTTVNTGFAVLNPVGLQLTSQISGGAVALGVTGVSPINRWIGGTDSLWTTAANWSTGSVPTTGQAVIIDNASYCFGDCSGSSVTLNTSITVDQLKSGPNHSLDLTVGTLTLSQNSGLNGSLNWTGGTITGTGKLTTTGTTTLSGTSSKNLTNKTWDNSGTVNYSGTNWFINDTSSTDGITTTVNNLTGGTFNFSSTDEAEPIYGSGSDNRSVFNNAGTIEWSSTYLPSTTNYSEIYLIDFNNQTGGVLNVNQNLRLLSSNTTNAGTINIASGKELILANNSLTLDSGSNLQANGTLRISGGTLNVNAQPTFASGVALQIDGGSLISNINLTLANPLNWTGGTITGTGKLTTTGTTTLSGTSSKNLTNKTWDNSGTVTLSGSNYLYLNDTLSNDTVTTTFNNLAGGTVNVNTAGELYPIYGSGPTRSTFNNLGTLNWNSTYTTTSDYTYLYNTQFNNQKTTTATGTVNVNQNLWFAATDSNNAGTFNIASNKELRYTGNTHTLQAGSVVQSADTTAGGGTLTVTGGTVNANGTIGLATTGNILLSSGTLNWDQDGTSVTAVTLANPLTITGGILNATDDLTVPTLNWTGGTITGSGKLITNGTSTLNGSSTTYLENKVWDNSGTVTFSGSNFFYLNDTLSNDTVTTTFNNLAGGTVNVNTAGELYPIYGSGPTRSTFNNLGTLNWNSTYTTTSDYTYLYNTQFNNQKTTTATGTVNVNQNLWFAATDSNNAGTFNIASAKELRYTSGTNTSNGLINLGTDGKVASNTNWTNNGTISGTGTVDVGSFSTFTNQGFLSPGGPGAASTLNITGNLVLGANSTVEFEIGGVNAGTDYDRLVVSGAATVGGMLTGLLINGYTPAVDQSFDILTATTASGSFTNNLPSGFNGAVINGNLYRLTKSNLSCLGICWDGGGGSDINWTTAANWTGDVLPGTGDVAYLNLVSGATVELGGTASIKGLNSTSNNNLTINTGGTLVLNDANITSTLQGGLTLNGGTLEHAGPLNLGGPFNVNATSTLGGVGTLTTNGFTSINMPNISSGSLRLAGKNWNNLGTLSIGGDDYLTAISGTNVVTNLSAGVMEVSSTNDHAIGGLSTGASLTINNQGTLNATNGNLANNAVLIDESVTFNNSGQVRVSADLMQISGPGTDTGTYSIDAGKDLYFGGGRTGISRQFGGTDRFLGAGTVRFIVGSTYTFNANLISTGGASVTIDTNGDGGPIVLLFVENPPDNGTVVVRGAEGTITYTPNPGFSDGTDSFTYQFKDSANTIFEATVAVSVSGNGTVVTPVTVTVTAVNGSKVYGSTDPSLAYTITSSNPDIPFNGSLSRTAGENVGGYSITQGSLTCGLPNCSISFVPGTFSITRRDLAEWIGGASTSNWSDAANWSGNILPSLSNVASVSIPSGNTVNANLSGVNLDSLTSDGNVIFSANNFTVSNALTTVGYSQSTGTVSAGSLNVSNSFSQTGGTLNVSGAASITQASGDLVAAGLVRAGSLNLVASGGNIGNATNAAFTRTGALTFEASGNVFIRNNDPLKGASPAQFTVNGTAGGSVDIRNHGGLVVAQNTSVTSGTTLAMQTFSPMTINGSLSAGSNINLTANNGGALSLGNTASVTSTSGAINLTAGSVSISPSITVSPTPTITLTSVSQQPSAIVNTQQEVADKSTPETETAVTPTETSEVRPPLTFLDDDPEVVLYTLMQLDAAAQEEEEEQELEQEQKAPSSSTQERATDEQRKPDYCPC
jgi:filamentous hemagglutinin family protein